MVRTEFSRPESILLLTLTFWLVRLQLSSILNKEAIIIIIVIIIIIIMEEIIVKVSSWIKYYILCWAL